MRFSSKVDWARSDLTGLVGEVFEQGVCDVIPGTTIRVSTHLLHIHVIHRYRWFHLNIVGTWGSDVLFFVYHIHVIHRYRWWRERSESLR